MQKALTAPSRMCGLRLKEILTWRGVMTKRASSVNVCCPTKSGTMSLGTTSVIRSGKRQFDSYSRSMNQFCYGFGLASGIRSVTNAWRFYRCEEENKLGYVDTSQFYC